MQKWKTKNLSPLKATEEAMHEISGAIIAITLVMAAVFIPVAFMSGPVGIFYRQFSITMSTSIILSGVVALTLTPALCAIMLKNTHGKPKKKTVLKKFLTGLIIGSTGLLVDTKSSCGNIVNRRVITFGMLIAFCVGTWFLSTSLPSGFIPNEDQGMFYAIIQTPPGSTLERTDEVAEKLQKIAEGIEDMQSVSSLAGYEILSEGTGANTGTCLVNLKDWDERKHSVQEIIT